MKHRLKTIGWSFSLAWKFNKTMLIVWGTLMSAVSVLPAVAVQYNKVIVTGLNEFLSTGQGSFDDMLPTIIMFGVITALVGISSRLNADFFYSVMMDSYYFGMEELLMDSVQDISMEKLLKKDVKDDYHFAVMREGALTDFISGFCASLGKFIGIVSLLIVAFSLSKLIFVFSMIYIVGVTWINAVFIDKLRYSWEKIRANERLAGHYENIPYSPEYAKELRIFESKETLVKNWKGAYAAIYDFEIKNNFAVELRSFISGFGFYIFLSIMILYSVFMVAEGSMTSAVLLTVFTLCLSIFNAIPSVTRTLMIMDHGLYALDKQYKIFGAKKNAGQTAADKENPDNTYESNVVFETKDLSYSYKSEKLAVDNVSLALKRGETVALVGVNGSGKSTIIKLLLQLYKPLEGNIYFCGKDYGKLEKGFLKNRIGAFFQDYYLFHMPVAENVGFGDIGSVNDAEKIGSALEKGGASAFVSRLAKGADTFVYKWIEETGTELSGGEKQKIAVSRAHMSNKDILIFDEPASMLDPISELEQFMNIKEKLEGQTAILISHRVGFARLADKIILLSNGKIAESGTHDELMAKDGMYAHFFNEQAQWYKKEMENE